MSRDEQYDAILRLADEFVIAGQEMRARARLGAEVLADEAVTGSAPLSPVTWAATERELLAATTGRGGLLARSIELDADAVVLRATVLTYRWIDELQEAALRSLGSIAARAVGYLAPQVELGGALFGGGVIDADGLDPEGLTGYLNELAEAHPEVLDHLVTGGGGLLDALQLRGLLTTGAPTGPHAAAVARGGLAATGGDGFAGDFGAALRDAAAAFDEDEAVSPVLPVETSGDAPRTLAELLDTLARTTEPVRVHRVGSNRFIAYLTHRAAPVRGGLRLVGAGDDGHSRGVLAALEQATAGVDDARVMLVGHARGGVTAAELAALGHPGFTIDQVVTVGSPAAHVPRIAPSTSVLSLEDRADPVALLGSLVNARERNRLTVVFDADGTGTPYVAGGRAVDASAHPELRAVLGRLRGLGFLAG